MEQALILSQFLKKEGLPEKGVAVAVNATCIPKSRWGETLLEDKDKIEVITVMQGG